MKIKSKRVALLREDGAPWETLAKTIAKVFFAMVNRRAKRRECDRENLGLGVNPPGWRLRIHTAYTYLPMSECMFPDMAQLVPSGVRRSNH